MTRLTYRNAGQWQLKETQLLGCKWACDNVKSCDKCIVGNALDKLTEYEDAEEQGLLLRLPCKVGDTVYAPLPNNEISIRKVRTIDIGGSYIDFLLVYAGDDEEFIGERFLLPINDFGETVFLTREEAEQKLKELNSNGKNS